MEGSKRITEDILSQARGKGKELEEAAKREAQTIVHAAEIAAKEDLERRLAEAREKGKQLLREKVMKEKLALRKEILELREQLVGEVMEEVRRRLQEFTKTQAYREWLKRKLSEALSVLGKGAVVRMNPSDAKLARRLIRGIKVEADLQTIGGFKASSSDGKLLLDETFESRIRRRFEDLRVEVARILFS